MTTVAYGHSIEPVHCHFQTGRYHDGKLNAPILARRISHYKVRELETGIVVNTFLKVRNARRWLKENRR